MECSVCLEDTQMLTSHCVYAANWKETWSGGIFLKLIDFFNNIVFDSKCQSLKHKSFYLS